jgi:hypothetical protein
VITISDAAANSPQIIGLTGTAVAPVTFAPTSLAFGAVALGSTSAAKTVTLTNNQGTTLTGISLAASGNYSTASGGTTCTSSLGAGASCTISVTFSPTAKATINGAVGVNYAGAYSPREVKVTGSGTGGSASPLKFTPVSLTFTSQGVGTTSAAKTVTVQNTSASAVTLSSFVASGNFSAVGGSSTPCSNALVLAASAKCTIDVTFTPTFSGTIPGALTISDNASIAQQVVNLSGTAVLPVTIAPATLTFASQAKGTTSAAQILTLTNNSNSALGISSFVGSADYSVTSGGASPCTGSAAPHSSCTLSVTFTPTVAGTIKGAATITDGASTSPQVVKLTGTGS